VSIGGHPVETTSSRSPQRSRAATPCHATGLSVDPWGSGRVFQSFADPDLENWAGACYGTNLEPLVRVKARYDPGNVFRFHQSLPVG
jgi:Berberine and berberine like